MSRMNRRSFASGLMAAVSFGPGLARADRGAPLAASGASFVCDGREARLIDVLAPALGPVTNEPYAEKARKALQDLLASGELVLEDAAPVDRWGRRIVRAHIAQEGAPRRDIQAALVAQGALRVRPESADDTIILGLLALEAEARKAQRGLWAISRYRAYDADDARGAVGAFNLVQGTVMNAATGKGRVYLNFGSDYRQDFTITASTRLARQWKKQGVDLTTLAGAKLRARGHVAWINGPSIDLTHPRQIEIL